MPAPESVARPDADNRASLGGAHLTWRADGPHTIATLDGLLEVYEAPPLRETLWPLAEQTSGDLVLDLRGVEFLDSTCLGVLTRALKSKRAVGRTVRFVPGEGFRKILRITGLTEVFPSHETPDDALTAAARPPLP